MSIPLLTQMCSICTEVVTDAEYRRELTCSYAACPAKELPYHEECITKYLRKLKLPVDQLIGFQCPAVLDNGKPCSGRISGTHHRLPVNQKKKKKRVEAAAAAVAAFKAKPLVPKVKDAKPGVAAATAAMRPLGEGGHRVSVSVIKSAAPAVPTLKAVTPGSGPAARLKGTSLDASPEHVLQQQLIPGWTAPDKISREDRAKVVALQAEAKATTGRCTKAPPSLQQTQYTAAGHPSGILASGVNKDDADHHQYQSYQHYHFNDGGYTSQSAGAVSLGRYLSYELGRLPENDELTQPNFFLAQGDLATFPTAASPASSRESTAASSWGGGCKLAEGDVEFQVLSAGSSSLEGSPGGTLPSQGQGLDQPHFNEAASLYTPTAAAAEDTDPEADPVVHYDQLYPTEDNRFAVMDIYGNFIYMEDVYGQVPEVEGFDDGSSVITYYVLIRESMIRAMQEAAIAQEAMAIQDGGPAAVNTTVDNGAFIPVATDHTATSMPIYQMHTQVATTMTQVATRAGMTGTEQLGSVDDSDSKGPQATSQGEPHTAPSTQPNDTVDDGDQADDLSELLALCLDRAPAAELKATQSAGHTTNTAAGVADEETSEDLDSLMELLRV